MYALTLYRGLVQPCLESCEQLCSLSYEKDIIELEKVLQRADRKIQGPRDRDYVGTMLRYIQILKEGGMIDHTRL